jgi:hypothetical protein
MLLKFNVAQGLYVNPVLISLLSFLESRLKINIQIWMVIKEGTL